MNKTPIIVLALASFVCILGGCGQNTGWLLTPVSLDERLVDRMPKFMFANEQEMEDYATELSGDLFFARMSYNILRRLGTECVESSFPILVNFGLLK